MSVLTKIKKKLRSGTWYPLYNRFYEKEPVDPGMILLESRSGRGLESNIFALVKELNKPLYRDYTIVIPYAKGFREAVQKKLEQYGLKADRLVQVGSPAYYRCLSRAGILINDSTFPGRFIKKEGQTYLNVWHGTPLKCMGRDNTDERYSMGNVMRNLLMSDYLLFPNRFMEEKMAGAYMLGELYQGKILHECYPRNEIFFHPEEGVRMKETLGFQGKELFIYMPTFRGKADAVDKRDSVEEIRGCLRRLDALLKDGQVLLVKLHPFVGNALSFGEYSHIQPFPDKYDTYEVLNACDALITDYSSVMYDYANTGRKIILLAYDLEEYMGSRGVYEDIRTYPFPLVRTPEEAAQLLQEPSQPLEEGFRQKYCTYEHVGGIEKLCRQVVLKEEVCEVHRLPSDKKENVLIYAGDFDKNGITSSFCSLMKQLDKEKYNYFISYRLNSLKEAPERLQVLEEDAKVYPIASEMNLDILTALAQAVYLKTGYRGMGIGKRLDHAYDREWKKHFGTSVFCHVIHYNGYENYMLSLMERCPYPKTVWVHNDMVKEVETKKNPSPYVLGAAYRACDHVAAVSRDITGSITAISGREDNIVVIPNCQDYEEVRRKAGLELAFDEDTRSTVTRERLEEILKNKDRKFISIGRYSGEKRHDRLIEAFNRYWKEKKDTWLIIIGGQGSLYEQTCEKASGSEAGSHIILIRSMKNPMPVLSACDLFLLSSDYEGRPVVLYEADILGVPSVAPDVPGARGFMEDYGGFLVPPTVEGIFDGMKAWEEGKVSTLSVDCEQNNRTSVELFMELLGGF